MRAPRTAALLALVLGLWLPACGGDEERAAPPGAAATPTPTPTAPPGAERSAPEPTRAAREARPSGRVAARLAAGATAVVDLTGRIGIRPRALTFAKGGELEDLRWTRWGDREAEGAGTMVGLVCEPTCAQGTTISVPATITLSAPVACPDGRFFDRARIEVESDDPAAASTSWLAAPC